VATLSVDVDQDSAAQNGVTVAQDQSIVVLEVLALVVLDHLAHRACAVHSGVTVELVQIIVAGVSRLPICIFDSGTDR
jgi:hypothetical protein